MDLLKPYGHIRGFNYTPSTAFNDIAFWRDYDEALVECELTYAQRLGLNSARIFLAYVVYEHDPKAFLNRVRHFVRAAHERDISVMPAIWDSCFDDTMPTYDSQLNKWIPNPGVQRLTPDFWPAGERYCQDLVETLSSEPGLLIWDVMNEPRVTTWLNGPEGAERTEVIWTFVRHFCAVMKQLDPQNPITVGVHAAEDLSQVGPHVDVLSFHDYKPTRNTLRQHLDEGLAFAKEFQKPVLLSEIGCLARSNPYDMTFEICEEVGMGWYLWELMIGVSVWRDIHGVVYPDGTVRDPSIAAAIRGFYRKRRGDIVLPNVGKEGQATRVFQRATEWLQNSAGSYAEGLQILEQLANLLETGELIAMYEPPSVKVYALETETPDNHAEMRRLMSLWSDMLTEATKDNADGRKLVFETLVSS